MVSCEPKVSHHLVLCVILGVFGGILFLGSILGKILGALVIAVAVFGAVGGLCKSKTLLLWYMVGLLIMAIFDAIVFGLSIKDNDVIYLIVTSLAFLVNGVYGALLYRRQHYQQIK